MQVKLLRQAAGRDDRIVAAYEDVTFLNEHVGWYPIIKDRFRKANDIVVVVLRVGDVCFEAGSMFRRGMLRKEYIEARTAEARNLRAAVQRRMASCQWIPSSYVAAYEALGWDARPLKGIAPVCANCMLRKTEDGNKCGSNGKMTTAARGSAAENVIETGRGCFSGGRIRRNGTLYCLVRQIWDQYPPRTLGMLQRRIADLSRTQIHCKGVSRGFRISSLRGCRELIDRLAEKLK